MRYSRRTWLQRTSVVGAGLMTLPLRAAAPFDKCTMVRIPAGPFLQGTSARQARQLARDFRHHPSWLAGEVPQRTVDLPEIWIDRFPVTNRRYAVFVEATGYPPPADWKDDHPPVARLEHPVRYVNHADAEAFATWAGKRLPTAAEWEKAARGTDGRLFPWGDAFDPEACHHDRGGSTPPEGTVPVDATEKGASPYGIRDLIGNIAEYCADGPGPGSAYIKGGCWLTASPLNLRAAAVGMSGADNNALDYIGFRCVKDG